MKKIMIIALAMQILLAPALFSSEVTAKPDLRDLPEFTGSLNDPDILVIEEGDGYHIVLYKGKYYVVYDK